MSTVENKSPAEGLIKDRRGDEVPAVVTLPPGKTVVPGRPAATMKYEGRS